MRMLKLFLVVCVSLLSACVSMYSVRPVVDDSQVPVQNQGFESLRSTKKHMVQVGSIYNSMRQFDNPRFKVTFLNQGEFPVEFSSQNVTVSFNGQSASVVSYEAQLQDVQQRLSFYGLRTPIFFTHTGRGNGMFLQTDFNDRLDVQKAFADFEYIQMYMLKPSVVQSRQEVSGEILLADKLSASSAQDITVTVRVDGDAHVFKFGYLQIN